MEDSVTREVDLAKLGRFIADHFDLDQLQLLSQALDVPYYKLLGDTRSARSFDLVTTLRDRGQLSALMAAVARARPDDFDPQDFEREAEPARQRGTGWRYALWLVGGVALLLGGYIWWSGRPASSPAPRATPGLTVTGAVSPTRTPRSTSTRTPPAETATPIPGLLQTSTARPTERPFPTATGLPTTSPTSRTPSEEETGRVLAVPTLGPESPGLLYDAASRVLWLAPGDAALNRGRICTPLNAYQDVEAVYVIEDVAASLGLALPARARVTHFPADPTPQTPFTRTLEVLSHPVQGVKVSGEPADFTGCDLVLSASLREALGLPLSLEGFDAPPRFAHGWVRLEFVDASEVP
jgi:hypothetical protein